MIRFTTPCFVRVENPQERKELIEWLESIGYEVGGDPVGSIIQAYTDGSIEVWKNGEQMIAHAMPIDCGTNIPLFKALAAMNDENDLYQYFVDKKLGTGGNWLKSYNEDGNTEAMNLRKATAEENINYFKNKRS